MKCHLFWCNVLWSADFDFFANDNFPGTCVDFCFIMFAHVLMKELERMLIHVYENFNCRVSYRTLLWICLIIIENSPFKNITITVREVFLIQLYWLTVGSKQENEKEHKKDYGTFIPFKTQVYILHSTKDSIKTRELHFSLESFLLVFNVSMKMVNELYVFITL